MHAHRVPDHLIGGNALALITGVGQAGIGQVKGGVNLLSGHGWIGAVDLDGNVASGLPHIVTVPQVTLHLDSFEILCLGLFGLYAFLVRKKHYVGCGVGTGHFTQGPSHHCLRYVNQLFYALAGRQGIGNRQIGQLSHAVNQQVGWCVHKNRGPELVLPIVVMRQPPERHLDAACHNRHIRKEPFENLTIDDSGVVGACSCSSIGRISIITALAAGCGIMVDHRVHGTCRHAEIQPRPAQFLEVSQVVSPVGLRHDSHFVAMGLKDTSDNGAAHRRVVDVGVAREKNHIGLFPAQVFHLLAGGRQPLPSYVVVAISFVLLHSLSLSISSSFRISSRYCAASRKSMRLAASIIWVLRRSMAACISLPLM